jgi:hypothetical protein
MKKRGQVTVLILIGIALILIVGIAIFFLTQKTTDIETAEVEVDRSIGNEARFTSFIENCMEKQLLKGISIAGAQGGRIFMQDESSLITENAVIGYTYKNGDTILDYKDVELDLGYYVDLTFDECTNYFDIFKEEQFAISETGSYPINTEVIEFDLFDTLPLNSDVTLGEDLVSIDTTYPLQISKGNNQFTLQTFSVNVDSNIKETVKSALDITKNHHNGIDLAYLTSFDMLVNAFPYDADNTIYSMYSEETNPSFFLFVTENE